MENLKNGFLWGLGFGAAITIIILAIQYLNPNEYEIRKDYAPTQIDSLEVMSTVRRVEGTNFIIAGEFNVTGNPEFEIYKIEALIRNKKGVFLQKCVTDIDKRSVEQEKTFTQVIVCRDFSDAESVSVLELKLIGFK